MEEEGTGRVNWNGEAFQGQGRNLVQWKFLGIYNGDSNEDS